ncbi:hypothetical protein HAV21_10350 [Paenarthrobacter sp. MSM-2-10-13]|uniref:hypothetical protein n=1 Tax=Micrococcaceae TaxID=1268 RepID=UPI00115CC0D8|nr:MULTISPECIES: hypothetical protein [Micrococcaceae]MCM0618530.1 hypothetical protein [Paenarthrobacter sp. TYUT067]NHW47287.1 hypothetical protein [Paenarthrobacter sp. MSM-2-10-13]TQS94470.1 hypothetical protein EU811_00085 [Arthrobacter sp. TS-15]
MIGSLASLASSVGTTIAAWIEAAYVLDCTGPSAEEQGAGGPGSMSDLSWLPALSGVTVASAQAIQTHAARVRSES